MAYPDGFWTFVDGNGRIYGSLAVAHDTAVQAWMDFYEGQRKEANAAVKAGCYCRPAQHGDLEAFR